MKTVITIGRENGSGGRLVGEALAKALGIKCYDKELLYETAKESGFAAGFIAENEEKKPNFFMGTGMFYAYEQPVSLQLYVEQSKIIKRIAEREPCVIVGRCSDYVLAEENNVLNVFIHAPLKDRITRVAARDNVSEDKAKSKIQKTDKARASYYNYYTNKTWGDAKNYHLSLDSSALGIEGCVNVILSCLNEMK